MKLSGLKSNKANPRTIKDVNFKKLCKSIKEFPKMMELRPIVIDTDGTILGGNMRFKALKELGYKEVPDNWIKRANELTDEEKQRFIIEDNVGFGEWDFEMLTADWDIENLNDWGLDVPSFDNKFEINENELTEDKESKDFVCKITFKNEDDTNKFISKYKAEIMEKFDCIISISGGGL